MPNGKYRLDDTRENQEKDSGLQADSNANQYDYRARPVGSVYSDGYNGRKPGVSLISLDKVLGSDGSYWRIAHNFDYYKDLPPLVPSKANGGPDDGQNKKMHMINKSSSDGKMPNYIEDEDFEYYVIDKDLQFVAKETLSNSILKIYSTVNHKNQAILNWEVRKDHNFYNSSVRNCDDYYDDLIVHFRDNSGISISNTINSLSYYKLSPYSYIIEVPPSFTPTGYNSQPYEYSNLIKYTKEYISISSGSITFYPENFIYYTRHASGGGNMYATDCTTPRFTEQSSNKIENLITSKTTREYINEQGIVHKYIYTGGEWEYTSETIQRTISENRVTTESFSRPSSSYSTNNKALSYKKSTIGKWHIINSDAERYDTFAFGAEYVNTFIGDSYIIDRTTLVDNPNYVFPKCNVHSEYNNSSDNGWHVSHDGGTVTIKPTLMHEHVVPCICPDSTIPLLLQDKQTKSQVLYVP